MGRKQAEEGSASGGVGDRRVRADARRNVEAVLEAAKAEFSASGVDAPVRAIAERAGVGVGTIYRHFPQRSDLIVGVFRREVDACADAAPPLAAAHGPGEALARWVHRYVDFLSAKRGLAAALHSGDPAYQALPDYFRGRLVPAFEGLLDAAEASGEVRGGVDPYELLGAIASLCAPRPGAKPDYSRRMADLLLDGLRHGRAGG